MDQIDEIRVPEVDRCVQGAVKDRIFTGAAVMASVDSEPFHRAVYGMAQEPPPRERLTCLFLTLSTTLLHSLCLSTM